MRGRKLPALAVVALLGCGYPSYVYLDDEVVVLDAAGDASDAGDDTQSDVCGKPNGCGGCNDKGIAGERCEPCGRWVCDGTVVACKQTEPAPGTPCGICKTSTYACTAFGLTVCANEDDRTIYRDIGFEARDQRLFVVDRTTELVATYNVARPVAYIDASFVVRRIPYVCSSVATLPHPDPECSSCKAKPGAGFDCSVPSPGVGTIKVTFYAGSPASGLAELGSVTVPATNVPTIAGWQSFGLAETIAPRTIGSRLSIGISTDSTGHAFEVYGAGPSAFPAPPAGLEWWRRTVRPVSAWAQEATTDVALVVRGKACAP